MAQLSETVDPGTDQEPDHADTSDDAEGGEPEAMDRSHRRPDSSEAP